MANLEGPTAGPATIELYGLIGEFRISRSPFRVRYFSTFANPKASGGHADLLDELEPMRDRLDASALKDLSSLLQRDLNDARVAEELVPYLQGARSRIGFFPAILAVLVPKNYLQGSENYPSPEKNEAYANTWSFGEYWSVNQYSLEGSPLPLGMLSIIRRKTDVIVLDGQHRATAFRFLAGSFHPKDTIYEAFYNNVSADQDFSADLPVTLIWFESEQPSEPVQPTLISRSLFIDVNNNAKPVSLARRILLDDRNVTCIGTQVLYSIAAEASFKPDTFSLLHGAFDMDSALAESNVHRFALTTPEIIDEALRWALFSSSNWDSLATWRVGRRPEPKTLTRYQQVFGISQSVSIAEEQEDMSNVYLSDVKQVREFRKLFAERYGPVLTALFNDMQFLKPHYEACRETNDWNSAPTVRDTWKKVFCGGQGLYWTFQSQKGAESAKDYVSAISSIEQHFSEQRAGIVGFSKGDTDSAYRSFATKAFMTGYVMAVDYLVRKVYYQDYVAAATNLVSRLNNYSFQNWLHIFSLLRPLLMGDSGTTPKSWPAYRNLLVRMYDSGKREIFDYTNLKDSPDYWAYKNLLDRRTQAIWDTSDTKPSAKEVKMHCVSEFESLRTTLMKCGLSADWFDQETVVDAGVEYAEQRLRKLFGEEAPSGLIEETDD